MSQKLNTSQKRGLMALLIIIGLIGGWKWHSIQSAEKFEQIVLDNQVLDSIPQAQKTKIELNSADSLQLVSVPGIGGKLASRIIRFRNRAGGFRSTEDLLQITGIRNGNFVAIEENVFVDTNSIAFTNLQKQKPKAQFQYSPQTFTQSNWPKQNKSNKINPENHPEHAFSAPSQTELASKSETISKSFASKPLAPIDINTADSASLVEISGIGPSTARNILKYRNLIFFFSDLSQLEEVWGIRPENLERMRPHLAIGSGNAGLRHLKINEMSVEELAKHKYMDFKTARILVAYREKHGPFKNFESFKPVLGVQHGTLLKLEPYFEY